MPFYLHCHLDSILKLKNITPYRLSKDTEERIGTIYKLVNNEIDNSRLPTNLIANICGHLEIGIGELFEVRNTEVLYVEIND